MVAPRFDYLDALKLRPADDILQESEAFFMKQGKVHATMKRLARDLEDEGISYAIIGGMALNLWGYTRETVDVDILLTPDGLANFKDRFVGRGYLLAFTGASKTFRDTQTQVKIEVITTGEYPGDGKPKPVVFPNPAESSIDRDGYRVIRLENLIELKLASGLSAAHRMKDLADVLELIVKLKLPLELADMLDASVRAEYRRLWEGAQSAPPEPGE
ncbi:MAG: hypothetical protein AABZ58_09450 [Chloroflexota bacterium]